MKVAFYGNCDKQEIVAITTKAIEMALQKECTIITDLEDKYYGIKEISGIPLFSSDADIIVGDFYECSFSDAELPIFVTDGTKKSLDSIEGVSSEGLVLIYIDYGSKECTNNVKARFSGIDIETIEGNIASRMTFLATGSFDSKVLTNSLKEFITEMLSGKLHLETTEVKRIVKALGGAL